ncbi:MAG: hypothetical protein MN733_09620, partial [Nitrososphaera sp.]|nr:hypothetical protein [Nitrososphaera sp.]
LIDGEGCFSSHSRIWFNPQMHMSQVDRRILDVAAEAAGLGTVTGPYGPYKMNKQPVYYWNINGHEKVQALLAMVWEWLGDIKRDQAQKVLEIYRCNKKNKKSGNEQSLAKKNKSALTSSAD